MFCNIIINLRVTTGQYFNLLRIYEVYTLKLKLELCYNSIVVAIFYQKLKGGISK